MSVDLEPTGARNEAMTRCVLVGGLLVLAGLLIAKPAATEMAAPAGATQPRLYGVHWQGSLGLVRVDPDTLRPLAGRRVPLAAEPLGWSFAPDRSRIVMGSTARGAKLRLIDLRAMRAVGDVRVTRRGSGIATTWAGPKRVLAVVVTPGCCGAGDTIVAGVDTGRRRVIWRRTSRRVAASRRALPPRLPACPRSARALGWPLAAGAGRARGGYPLDSPSRDPLRHGVERQGDSRLGPGTGR